MASGILETVGRMATALVVIPIVLLGLDLLYRGQLLAGIGFLGIVGLILAFERYVTRPGDIPTMISNRLVSTVVTVEDTDEE